MPIFACPDLSGTYQCSIDTDEAGDTGIISIKTDNTLSSTLYVITDQDYPENPEIYFSDNKQYELQDGSTYTGWCEDQTFKYTLSETDEYYGEMFGEVTLKLDSKNNLVTRGVLLFDSKKYESNDLCKKL